MRLGLPERSVSRFASTSRVQYASTSSPAVRFAAMVHRLSPGATTYGAPIGAGGVGGDAAGGGAGSAGTGEGSGAGGAVGGAGSGTVSRARPPRTSGAATGSS